MTSILVKKSQEFLKITYLLTIYLVHHGERDTSPTSNRFVENKSLGQLQKLNRGE